MKQLSLFDKKGRPFDKHSKKLERVRIFDNGGKTFDRYFVIIEEDTFTMSHNPMNPQGVNQYAGLDETSKARAWNRGGGALGILLDHIPPGIEPAILERIKDEEKMMQKMHPMHEAKVDELITDMAKTLKDTCRRLYSCGGINVESYDSKNYVLAKILVSAAMEQCKNNFYPVSDDFRKDLRNLLHF